MLHKIYYSSLNPQAHITFLVQLVVQGKFVFESFNMAFNAVRIYYVPRKKIK